jgi:hypothetical protein
MQGVGHVVSGVLVKLSINHQVDSHVIWSRPTRTDIDMVGWCMVQQSRLIEDRGTNSGGASSRMMDDQVAV